MKKITNGIFTPIIEIHEEIFQLFSQTCKPKTLEEVAERLYPTIHEQYQYDAFIQGAKWMQERMYSEEEVINAFNEGQALTVRGKLIQGKEWFEQFKKK